MIELLDSTKPILHLQRARRTPLAHVMLTLSSTLRLPLVPYSEWLTRLEEEAAKFARGETKPSTSLQAGIRLLDVFRAAVRDDDAKRSRTDSFGLFCKVASEGSASESAVLSGPESEIAEGAVLDWVHYWRNAGILA